MKRTTVFENLSPEDQQFVLRVCNENPYNAAVAILAKPRSEGGLDLQTSRSALSRFCAENHPDQLVIEVLGQYAEAVCNNGHLHVRTGFEAALTLVQARVLEALRDGKAIADLDREFRTLERLQRCVIADEKLQMENPFL